MMAIYGDGSKQNPFIIHNYDEFVSMVWTDNDNWAGVNSLIDDGTGNLVKLNKDFNTVIQELPSYTMYIEFDKNAENKIIDFNEIMPDNFEDFKGFQLNCSLTWSKTAIYNIIINGNDWTLKNMWTYKESLFNIPNIEDNSTYCKPSITFYHLNFLNMFQYCIYKLPAIFTVTLLNTSTGATKGFKFLYCRFSSLQSSNENNFYKIIFNNVGSNGANTTFDSRYVSFNGCSFNIRTTGKFNFFGCGKINNIDNTTFSVSFNKNYNDIFYNCNFRLFLDNIGMYTKKVNNTTTVISDFSTSFSATTINPAGFCPNSTIKYSFCKFSGVIVKQIYTFFVNDVLYNETAVKGSAGYYCVYQIKCKNKPNEDLTEEVYNPNNLANDMIKGFINSDYSENFPTGNNIISTTTENLLDLNYLLSNQFPVMAQDTEDNNLI